MVKLLKQKEIRHTSLMEKRKVNASLYNDYAVFLFKYKNDLNNSIKYLTKAIKTEPENMVYRANFARVMNEKEKNLSKIYTLFILAVVGIMLWLGYNGYTNYMNVLSLFAVIQLALHHQRKIVRVKTN